ncbi:transposase [Streptomyces sp. NPDC056796]|uniref:transposase n=1 Tax=Streptomyces sp. NPDC056796 TaxID=3345947 RepID=UPI003691D322
MDDFALYGGNHGTLLVDATTMLPLTLGKGRDAEQLSHRLREHPGVEVACRDGSLTYRQGITAGAPDATQVSDRFHLWQGLSRRVQDIASTHPGCLAAALPPDRKTGPAPVEEVAGNTAADTRAGRHVTPGPTPGRRWYVARPASPPAWIPTSTTCNNAGTRRNTARRSLHKELRTKGYLGHYQRVKMAVAPLRHGLPLDEPRERPPSPREAARWITAHPHRHSRHINDCLPRLLDHCPGLRTVHDLVRRFAAMIESRDATSLPQWLDDLANTGLAPLTGPARALHEDRQAVAQGITTPYNSGVNEGRITDVKLQKRLMAGRAGVLLLRRRVALIAHHRRRFPDRPYRPETGNTS